MSSGCKAEVAVEEAGQAAEPVARRTGSGCGVWRTNKWATGTGVTMPEVDVAESWGINGHGEVVLVGEPLQWWPNAGWRVPQTEWVFPRDRVVGLQFRGHNTTNRQVTKARQAWLKSLHTQSHCWAQSPPSTPVLYSYSDCPLDRVGVGLVGM